MNIPWFHNKGTLEEQQLEKLGELLRTEVTGANFSPLSREKKDKIRGHMFERIDALTGVAQQELPLVMAQIADGGEPDGDEAEAYLIDRLITWMKDTSQTVKMDPIKKAVIREHLYDLPDRVMSFPFFKRLTAAVSVAGILSITVFAFALKVPVTFAKELTIVHDVEGSVMILRNGRELPLSKGLELHEGDKIVTGENGKAVITYFDKSITRFFENTSVSFDALRSEDFGFNHTVSLNLTQGRVWSNVMDYVLNSDFTVKADDLIATASKRATFSLSSENHEASLQVFHNLVSVETPSNSETKTVVKGFQMVAKPETTRQIVEPIQLKESDKKWVAANLMNDQQVIGEVEKGNTGVAAGPLGKFQENASLFLAFNDDERFRLELNIAEKSFYETLKNPSATSDQVKGAFDGLQGIVTKVESLKSDDSKKLASAVLQSARNELLNAKPDSQIYDLKIALEDKDFSDAPEDTKLTLALDQASQFLAEAQDLQDKGLSEPAKKAAHKYQERMRDISALITAREEKKLPVEEALSSKRTGLEKLYTAYRNPTPVVEEVAKIAALPADGAKSDDVKLGDVASAGSPSASSVEGSSSTAVMGGGAPAAGASVSVTAATARDTATVGAGSTDSKTGSAVPPVEIAQPLVDADVPPEGESDLPPKLQINKY